MLSYRIDCSFGGKFFLCCLFGFGNLRNRVFKHMQFFCYFNHATYFFTQRARVERYWSMARYEHIFRTLRLFKNSSSINVYDIFGLVGLGINDFDVWIFQCSWISSPNCTYEYQELSLYVRTRNGTSFMRSTWIINRKRKLLL